MNVASWGVLFASIGLGSLGQFFLKLGVRQMGGVSLSPAQLPSTLVRVFSSPWIVGGVAMFAVSMFLWLRVLSTRELSSAYPMVSLNYVLVLLLAAVFLREPVSPQKLLGIAVTVAGVLLLNWE